MCCIIIVSVVLINLCLIAFPKSKEIMFRAEMFNRNSDSMNKSNFDTISHPPIPPSRFQLCLKFFERRKQFRKWWKVNKSLTLKVFGPWTLVLADGTEWMEKRQLRFATDQIAIFRFYEVDKLENEWWGRQFWCIWGGSAKVIIWSESDHFLQSTCLLKMPSRYLDMEILFHSMNPLLF